MKKGFTIIELAIVLIVIGVIAGFGTLRIVRAIQNTHANITEEEAIANLTGAVIQYAESNSDIKLPDSEEFNEIAKQYINDDNIRYIVAKGPLCQMESTQYKIEECENDDCSKYRNIDNIAFAIFSSGVNKAAEIIITDDTIRIPTKSKSDDQVSFKVLYPLKSELKCTGNLKIINNELPKIRSDKEKLGSISIMGENGVPPYYWCIQMPVGANIFSSTGLKSNILPQTLPCNNAGSYKAANYVEITRSASSNSLPVGNFGLFVSLKDSKGTIVNKPLVLAVTDMLSETSSSAEDDIFKKYSCSYIKDKKNNTILICKKPGKPNGKQYCEVDYLTEEGIHKATKCKYRPEDFID